MKKDEKDFRNSEPEEEPFTLRAVNRWVDGEQVPDVNTILRLAKRRLDPTYLLLGEGKSELDLDPTDDSAPGIRQAVVSELTRRFPNQEGLLRRIVPWGADILEEIADIYQERVNEALARFPRAVRLDALEKAKKEPDTAKRNQLLAYLGAMEGGARVEGKFSKVTTRAQSQPTASADAASADVLGPGVTGQEQEQEQEQEEYSKSMEKQLEANPALFEEFCRSELSRAPRRGVLQLLLKHAEEELLPFEQKQIIPILKRRLTSASRSPHANAP